MSSLKEVIDLKDKAPSRNVTNGAREFYDWLKRALSTPEK
jgi:hypothetical protein